jgi:hypothetical protein
LSHADELTEAEQRVWEAFTTGALVDLGGPDVVTGPATPSEPVAPSEHDDSQHVRAQVIAQLLTGAVPPRGGATAKLRLAGARITGALDLNGAQVACEFELDRCLFDEAIDLGDAVTRGVVIVSSRLPRLDAHGLETDGPLILTGISATEISLNGAEIAGQVDLGRAQLFNPGGIALLADRLCVASDLFVNDGFTVSGCVRLIGADVRGQLNLGGARLINPGGDALLAEELTVGTDMFCGDGFTAAGTVSLIGAHVGGQLNLSGARLTNEDDDALLAEGITVDQDLICRCGFAVTGVVSLRGGRVGGQLDLNGARLTNPGGDALLADRLTVDQEVFLGEGFRATGAVRLSGAHVGGTLDIGDALVTNPGRHALRADGLVVEQDMVCREGFVAEGSSSLVGAVITGELVLGGDGLAQACLDGVRYGGLYPPSRSNRLLAWLDKHAHGFHAQPYEQLASWLRGLGQDAGARKVLLHRERRRRRELSWWRRTPGLLLDALSGYGYVPARSVLWLLGALLFGWVYLLLVGAPPPVPETAAPEFSPAYAALYSFDVVLPGSPFGQEGRWSPAGATLAVVTCLQAVGWLLSIAIIPAISRSLTRT